VTLVGLNRATSSKPSAAILVCLLVATVSCGERDSETQLAPVSDGKRSYNDFKQAVGSFPYTAPQERQNRIRSGYAQVAVGANKDEVARALGEPDFTQNDYSKEARPGWLGSSWSYYLSKRSDGGNVSDPVVHVFFGTDGRATWIVPSNIEGLHEKGSPSRSRT
jgi:hypothetical protein